MNRKTNVKINIGSNKDFETYIDFFLIYREKIWNILGNNWKLTRKGSSNLFEKFANKCETIFFNK